MVESAGILLFRRRGETLEVLLGHPGGPFFARKDSGAWTIPKGEVEPGADLATEARREFREETGLDLAGRALQPLGSIKQKGGKIVHAFACEGDLDPEAFTSNTFEIEWPPGTGTRQAFPEIDLLAWFDPGEARRRVNPAQVPLLDRLGELLGSEPRDRGEDNG